MLFLSYFFDDVVWLETEVEYFLYDLWRQVPELLCPESKLGEVFRFHTFAFEVIPRPLNELDAVHSRHNVVNNHEGNLILAYIAVKLANGLRYWASAVKERSLAPEFELVKKNILEGKLSVHLIFKDQNFSLRDINGIRKNTIINANLYRFVVWKDFSFYV